MILYRRGSRGPVVLAFKKQLYALGYLKVKPTHDRFGGDTLAAVKLFQTAAGIKVDGIVGDETLRYLSMAKPVAKPDNADLEAKRERMLDYFEKAVGDLYVWGAQGQVVTNGVIDQRAQRSPKYVTPARAARFKKYAADHPQKPNGEPLRCFDCSGLFWAAENIVELPLEKNKDIDDSTAAGLYKYYCDPISKTELQPLDLVFSGNPITHVAIVGRNGKIYEAAGSEIGVVVNADVDTRTMQSIYGSKYGCLETYIKPQWTRFGRLKIFN